MAVGREGEEWEEEDFQPFFFDSLNMNNKLSKINKKKDDARNPLPLLSPHSMLSSYLIRE